MTPWPSRKTKAFHKTVVCIWSQWHSVEWLGFNFLLWTNLSSLLAMKSRGHLLDDELSAVFFECRGFNAALTIYLATAVTVQCPPVQTRGGLCGP